ncbi:MAG TPA: L-ribulose-5-phosphate 4-epimerase AraD [Candidatus Acidoferrum sp.]|jgi:L-ribulose-5-phosphate 4-epimerase|nr:L-ribulose-5-phosphate 4-epimerase AraD [Candidatus Acidoferrum sp.]
MLQDLKSRVCQANLDLVKEGLVIHTWGNASGIDRAKGLVVIKPSGVPYSAMRPGHMVVVALESGRVVEGKLKPSSDTATHLVLYRAFMGIGGIVHTHSLHATAWAQTGRPVPALGTTHADYFHGSIPCTRVLRPNEIKADYEANTGKAIVEAFDHRDPLACPAALVASHGPFAWGRSVEDGVHHAAVLEHLVKLAGETLRLFPSTRPMQQVLLGKHFFRKHGPGAYYGQGPSAKATASRNHKHH